MALIVQKYGGSSLADATLIRRIAARVVSEHHAGNQVVVVVSAMGNTTDDLITLARQVCDDPPAREMDMLLSVGERTSIALVSMAIHHQGSPAVSFTGSQVGIVTDTHHTAARILEVKGLRIREALDEGKVVVVAGYQGVSVEKEITTLGRGGTDTTAIALAAALKADRCEIMKDVDGIFVAEPRLVPGTPLNSVLSYDEMIEMANMGAGVLKTESVETARYYGVPIRVGSSFTGNIGTIITDRGHDSSGISGIVGQKGAALLECSAHDPKALLNVHRRMAERRAKSLMHATDGLDAKWVVGSEAAQALADGILKGSGSPGASFRVTPHMGTVAVIGTGLNFNSDTAATVFEVLEEMALDTRWIHVTELRIAVLLESDVVDEAVLRIHDRLIPEAH